MWGRDQHCLQNFPRVQLATKYERVLRHCYSSRIPYVERQIGEYRSISHQGQRKLLISEIEFLTLALTPGNSDKTLVIYAGAAPGLHIPMLSDMFPSCIFHLFDPATFRINENERIKMFNQRFTDAEAHYYRHGYDRTLTPGGLVFISDIRTKIDEKSVWGDMSMQKQWHEILDPDMTSLKFRLPWDKNPEACVRYLDGDVYFPVWGRTSTTECRLFVDKRKHKADTNYFPLAYEEEMSYFNRVTRPAIHLHTIKESRLDRCYDCASEVWVIRQYLSRFHVCSNIAVAALSDTISEMLKQHKMKVSPVRCQPLVSLDMHNQDEVHRENERLQLSQFWEKYSWERFSDFLRIHVNPRGPGCTCISCYTQSQTCEPMAPCKFKPWFITQAQAHGMEVAVLSQKHNVDVKPVFHACSRDSFVLDVDSHFTTYKTDDWSPIRYGNKLWKACSVSCPELQKLVALVQVMVNLHHIDNCMLTN